MLGVEGLPIQLEVVAAAAPLGLWCVLLSYRVRGRAFSDRVSSFRAFFGVAPESFIEDTSAQFLSYTPSPCRPGPASGPVESELSSGCLVLKLLWTPEAAFRSLQPARCPQAPCLLSTLPCPEHRRKGKHFLCSVAASPPLRMGARKVPFCHHESHTGSGQPCDCIIPL